MIEFYYKTIFYILFVIVIILSVVLLTRNNLNLKLEGFTTPVTVNQHKDSSGRLLNKLKMSSSTSIGNTFTIILVIENNNISIENSETSATNIIDLVEIDRLTGKNRVTLLKNNILKNEISVNYTINGVDYTSNKFSFEYITTEKRTVYSANTAYNTSKTPDNYTALLDEKITYLKYLLDGFDSVLKDLEKKLLLEIKKGRSANNNEITKLKNDISRISKEKRVKRIELYELEIKKIKDSINKKITKKNELTTIGDTRINAEKIIDTDINTLSAKLKTAQEKLSKFKSDYDGEDFLKGLVEADPNVVREKKLNNMIDKKTIKDLGKYVTSFVALQTSIASKIDTLDRKLEAADIEDKQRFYGDTKEKSIYNKNFLNIKNVVFSKYFFDEYTNNKKDGSKVTGKHKDAYLTLIKSEKNMTRSEDNVFEFEDNLYYIKLDNGFLKYNSIDNYEVCNIDIEKLSVLPENKYGFCQTPKKYGVFNNNKNSYKLNLGKFKKNGSNNNQIVSIKVFPWAVAANAYKDRIIEIGKKTFKITNNNSVNGSSDNLQLTLSENRDDTTTVDVILLSEWPSYQKMVQEFPTNIPLTENCIDDRSYLFSLIKIYNIDQLEFYTKLIPDKKTKDAIVDINTKMYAESQPLFYLIAPFNYNLQFVSIDITDNEEKLLSIDYAKEETKDDNAKLYFFLSDEYDFGDNDEMIDHIRESITDCEKKRCS